MRDKIKSPCIQVCKYDSDDICMGCHRSMEEITGWLFMSDDKKQEIMERVEIRRSTVKTEQNNYDHYV
ncbi:MAG TPA: DUF1289 domain-containing protein [Bacteroidales bacterium]|nr:DUF1289 domain-containing protein [Bacteroidales bacterium]HPE56182.1 DUF1289 domain-containing protein [Bacteroidales bacterium]